MKFHSIGAEPTIRDHSSKQVCRLNIACLRLGTKYLGQQSTAVSPLFNPWSITFGIGFSKGTFQLFEEIVDVGTNAAPELVIEPLSAFVATPTVAYPEGQASPGEK